MTDRKPFVPENLRRTTDRLYPFFVKCEMNVDSLHVYVQKGQCSIVSILA